MTVWLENQHSIWSRPIRLGFDAALLGNIGDGDPSPNEIFGGLGMSNIRQSHSQ
jgi:hypothetical protein